MKKVITIMLIGLLMIGCIRNKTPRHVGAVSVDGIASILNAGIQVDDAMYNSGGLNAVETKKLATAIDKLTTANDALIVNVRSLPTVAGNQGQILQWIAQFDAQLKSQVDAGDFAVTNKNSQARIDTFISSIGFALQAYESYIGSAPVGATGQEAINQLSAIAQKAKAGVQ